MTYGCYHCTYIYILILCLLTMDIIIVLVLKDLLTVYLPVTIL